MPEASPPFRRWLLGQRLRQLRESLGLTGEQAARAADRSASWISRLENGRLGLRRRELQDLLEKYQATDPDLYAELEQLADEGRRHPWFSEYRNLVPEDYYLYMGYEAEASRVEWFGLALVPGQLQTEEYARAIQMEYDPESPERLVTAHVALRMRRQELLFGARALPFVALLAEAALYHQVGGPITLRDQLGALLDAIERPNVEVYVIPRTTGISATILENVTIMAFQQTDAKIVHVETHKGWFEDGQRAAKQIELYQRLRSLALDLDDTKRAIRKARNEIESE
jgi:transcriptional regulator with XRE-family HTH domain